MLQGDSIRGRSPVDHPSDLRARYPNMFYVVHYRLSVKWHIGYMNSSSYSNTDVQREVSSGPDGSQSGVWRQRSIRPKLRG